MLNKHNIKLLTGMLVLLLVVGCTQPIKTTNNKTVTVQIKYSNDSIVTKTIAWHEGLTALESLQFAAKVETHPLGKKYVMVTSINNTKGEKGKMAWYYNVNGKSPHVVAINKIVNTTDTIQWRYVKDHCSATVNK